VLVDLGGSSVSNLADSLLSFGSWRDRRTCTPRPTKSSGHGSGAVPRVVPNYPALSEILDTSYLQAVARRAAPTAQVIAATKPHYEKRRTVQRQLSRKAWHSSSNRARPLHTGGQTQLEKLRRDLLVASARRRDHGHTATRGNPNANMALSEAARSRLSMVGEAVPVNFPEGRVGSLRTPATRPRPTPRPRDARRTGGSRSSSGRHLVKRV